MDDIDSAPSASGDELSDALPTLQNKSDEEEEQDVAAKTMLTADGLPDPDDNDLWDDSYRAVFTDGEMQILENGKSRWMGYKGTGKKDFFDQMLAALQELPTIKSLSGGEWDLRIKAYRMWLSNHSRKRTNHSRLKVGNAWNLRSVIQETHREEIKQWIKDRHNVRLGTTDALKNHQKELTEYLGDLSDDEIQRAEKLARDWNLKDGPTADIKAQYAEEHGGDLMEEFAREMWRSCGMRIVMLTGFKDVGGNVVTAVGDFNDKFKGGSQFKAVTKLGPEWQDFITQQIGVGRMQHSDGEEDSDASVGFTDLRARSKKVDPASFVTQSDGTIWIPDLTGKTRLELQSLIRGYITAKYREACRNPKANAPFKKLPKMYKKMIHGRHLPPGFELTGDPSHMKVEDARVFLNFLVKRQRTHPSDTFKFTRWLNHKGELQEVSETESEDDSSPAMSKKAKGKQSELGTHGPAKGNVDDDDNEETDPDSDALPDRHRGRPSQTSRPQHPRPRPIVPQPHGADADAVPPPPNQLARNRSTEAQRRRVNDELDPDDSPSRIADKGKQVRRPQSNANRPRVEESDGPDTSPPRRVRNGYDCDDESNDGDQRHRVTQRNGGAKQTSKSTRTVIAPRNIETPHNASDGRDRNDHRFPIQDGERRSTRARKVPKAKDADVPSPSRKASHKRKHSGNGKDGEKRQRGT